MTTAVRIAAHAKVNLFLRILARETSGFHQIETAFALLELADELVVRRTDAGVALEVDGPDLGPVEQNLAVRAARAVLDATGNRFGVAIALSKRIPVRAGLGGGSSDAAAALRGYLRLTRRDIPEHRLMEIAAALGADVPFFLFGGRALGIGRGDEIYPLPDISKQALLIVSPRDIHVPTPDAYRWLKAAALTKSAATPKLFKFCSLCWSAQESGLSNDFEPPVFRRHPRLAAIKRELLRRGATEASLAGSGSAVFGVFPSPALARRAAVGFQDDQTFVCETISRDRYLRKVNRAS